MNTCFVYCSAPSYQSSSKVASSNISNFPSRSRRNGARQTRVNLVFPSPTRLLSYQMLPKCPTWNCLLPLLNCSATCLEAACAHRMTAAWSNPRPPFSFDVVMTGLNPTATRLRRKSRNAVSVPLATAWWKDSANRRACSAMKVFFSVNSCSRYISSENQCSKRTKAIYQDSIFYQERYSNTAISYSISTTLYRVAL